MNGGDFRAVGMGVEAFGLWSPILFTWCPTSSFCSSSLNGSSSSPHLFGSRCECIIIEVIPLGLCMSAGHVITRLLDVAVAVDHWKRYMLYGASALGLFHTC